MKIRSRVNESVKPGRDSGFTLIELLVVIIIIGILAGVAVVGVSGARNTAQKAACKADAAQLVKGLRAYSAANGLAFPGARTSGSFSDAEIAELWTGTSKFIENEIPSYGTLSTTTVYVLTATVSSGELTVVGTTRGSANEFQGDCTVTG